MMLRWLMSIHAVGLVLAFDAQAARSAPPPRPLERVVVDDQGTGFVGRETGRPLVLWGVNYDRDDGGRLIEDYWHDEWQTVVEDFQEMKALGANIVRVHLQVGQFMESAERPNAKNLDRLNKLIELAEETRLYLNLTGLGCYHKQEVPAWYDELSEADRWRVQAGFWKAVAEVGRGKPAVFCYNLMNEPILPGRDGQETEWLAGELAGKHFVQRISLDLAGRTRQDVAADWVKTLTDAIREVDETTLLTVGVIPWAHVFPRAKPLFYDAEVGGPLDFVSVHFYPRRGEVEAALEALAVYRVGKPLVIEEIFPLRADIEETAEFIEQSREITAGHLSFYWGATIEENERKETIAAAITAAWHRYFRDNVPPEAVLPDAR